MDDKMRAAMGRDQDIPDPKIYESAFKQNDTSVQLQYFDGEKWNLVSEWAFEQMAWISLGGDNLNYRTIDKNGKILTDMSV